MNLLSEFQFNNSVIWKFINKDRDLIGEGAREQQKCVESTGTVCCATATLISQHFSSGKKKQSKT